MIPVAAQQLATFWSRNASKTVALWTDSSYGPLQQDDIIKLANELQFPLCSFNCSFGGGLVVRSPHDPAGQPAEIVFIEMGYNDDGKMTLAQAVNSMRQRKWYTVLKASASLVKFVVFVHQPTYKQTCPPKKKKKKAPAPWTPGALVEGSKFIDEAIKQVEQLGIPAICLKVPAEELYQGMLSVDPDGIARQIGCRSYSQNGIDYTEGGDLAFWEDSWHPTNAGAQTHFRCLVKAFRARYETAGVAAEPVALPSTTNFQAPLPMWIAREVQQAWMNQMLPVATGLAQYGSRDRSRSREKQRNAY